MCPRISPGQSIQCYVFESVIRVSVLIRPLLHVPPLSQRTDFYDKKYPPDTKGIAFRKYCLLVFIVINFFSRLHCSHVLSVLIRVILRSLCLSVVCFYALSFYPSGPYFMIIINILCVCISVYLIRTISDPDCCPNYSLFYWLHFIYHPKTRNKQLYLSCSVVFSPLFFIKTEYLTAKCSTRSIIISIINSHCELQTDILKSAIPLPRDTVHFPFLCDLCSDTRDWICFFFRVRFACFRAICDSQHYHCVSDSFLLCRSVSV